MILLEVQENFVQYTVARIDINVPVGLVSFQYFRVCREKLFSTKLSVFMFTLLIKSTLRQTRLNVAVS